MRPSTKICATCGERFEAPAAYCQRDGAPLDDLPAAVAPASAGGLGCTDPRRGVGVDPRLGIEIAGGVRIERLAGLGAAGRVYRAHQAGVERTVAVKVMLEPLGDPARALARFHREARLASRIVHPNVVTVLLTGELPESAGEAAGEPFAVLEWLEGPTLEAVLAAARASDEALDLLRALRIALGVAEGVGEAHRASVLHRDLKPSNVALVRRGDDLDAVKVLDFGLAALSVPEGAPEGVPEGTHGIQGTRAGATAAITGEGIVGTVRYLAPEAARGGACAASDVHAMAAMLYESLSGRPPFEGERAAAVLAARASREPADVRTHARAAYVPAPLAALLARALSRDPARRPQTGAALARDLLHAATASGLDAEDLLGSRGEGSARPIRLAPQQRTRPHDPRVAPTTGARQRRG